MTGASSATWVDVEGGRLPVYVNGQGPVVLFVHGWALDHRSFEPQVRPLARDFTVVRFDRRGFGRSQARASLDAELDDILRILLSVGADQMHLVGVSQGGRIALRFAEHHPDKLKSLVVQGAMVDGLNIEDDGAERLPLSEFTALARERRLDVLRARWLQHPLLGATQGSNDSAATALRAIVNDYTARDLLELPVAPTTRRYAPLEVLPSLAAPVLVVTGSSETTARKAHARAIAQAARVGQETVLADCGHLPNIENPAAFNRALEDFWHNPDLFRCSGVS